jgi:hypothetical protein
MILLSYLSSPLKVRGERGVMNRHLEGDKKQPETPFVPLALRGMLKAENLLLRGTVKQWLQTSVEQPRCNRHNYGRMMHEADDVSDRLGRCGNLYPHLDSLARRERERDGKGGVLWQRNFIL